MNVKYIFIGVGVIVLIIIFVFVFSGDKMALCVITDINKINKIGTCNTDDDCPSYASVCELKSKKCMPANAITEKNITYINAPSKKECELMGGSWELIDKNLLNPR
ncbi:MAG: hypothetical protein ABIH72_01120 [archaeon]